MLKISPTLKIEPRANSKRKSPIKPRKSIAWKSKSHKNLNSSKKPKFKSKRTKLSSLTDRETSLIMNLIWTPLKRATNMTLMCTTTSSNNSPKNSTPALKLLNSWSQPNLLDTLTKEWAWTTLLIKLKEAVSKFIDKFEQKK